MKKTILLGLLALGSLSFQACNENKKQSADAVENANDANDVKENNNSGQEDDDNDFAVKAADGGMLEVESAKLAQQMATSQAVKDYAAMMIRDHEKANAELKALAAKKNITLPTTLGEDSQKHLAEMREMKGRDFDKHYVDMMVDDHEKDVKLFEEAADDAEDAEIKAFAAKTLPTLREHMTKIKAIKDGMK